MAKIMIIEDDKMMIDLLGMLLGMEGYQIIKYNDQMKIEEILKGIRQESPDLVLLDVFLYDLDGCKVLESIRKEDDIKSLPIIMTSGMALHKDCLDKGADDFIMKPYMLEELVSKINHCLGEVA